MRADVADFADSGSAAADSADSPLRREPVSCDELWVMFMSRVHCNVGAAKMILDLLDLQSSFSAKNLQEWSR